MRTSAMRVPMYLSMSISEFASDVLTMPIPGTEGRHASCARRGRSVVSSAADWKTDTGATGRPVQRRPCSSACSASQGPPAPRFDCGVYSAGARRRCLVWRDVTRQARQGLAYVEERQGRHVLARLACQQSPKLLLASA